MASAPPSPASPASPAPPNPHRPTVPFVLLLVVLASLAIVGILGSVFALTLLRTHSDLTSARATCPFVDLPDPGKLSWHPGDQVLLHWFRAPCEPGTAAGLPITLTARLYGPFASDDAASAFSESACAAVSATPPPSIALAAAAPALHTDTSATKGLTQTLLLPPSLSPGVYAVVTRADIYHVEIGTTGSGYCFPLHLMQP